MGVAANQHMLNGGLNLYVLELVVLYLGGIVAELLEDTTQEGGAG
jgi:hypothetical protein